MSRVTPTRALVALACTLVAGLGCDGTRELRDVPEPLLGVWKTPAKRYETRFLEIRHDTLIFGVVGFLFRRFGFSVAPVAIGLILGKMLETNLQNSLKIFDGAWWQIFTQPLAAFFLLLAAVGLMWPIIGGRLAAWRSRTDPVGLNE